MWHIWNVELIVLLSQWRGTLPTSSASKCLSANVWMHLDSHWKLIWHGYILVLRTIIWYQESCRIFTEHTASYLCWQNGLHWLRPNWFRSSCTVLNCCFCFRFSDPSPPIRMQNVWLFDVRHLMFDLAVFCSLYRLYSFVYMSVALLVTRDGLFLSFNSRNSQFMTPSFNKSLSLSWTKYQTSHSPSTDHEGGVTCSTIYHEPCVLHITAIHAQSILYTVLYKVS